MQKMSRVSTLIIVISLLILTVNALAGQYLYWDEKAVPLRQGYHIEWQRAGAQDPDGNVCYVWSDCRNGERDIYAQFISPSGAVLWETGGKVVISASIRQEDPDIIYDGFGGFLISWVDYRDDPLGDVRAQRLDSEGNQLWDIEGVVVCAVDTAASLTLHTMPDGEGGAMIVWNDNRYGDDGDLFAHHIFANGTPDPDWPLNGLLIAGGQGYQGGPGDQTVDTDGNGGIWVGYRDTRSSGDPNIYIQHVDTEGNLMWGATEGRPLCTAPNDQLAPKLCPDGSGGAFIVWVDKRNNPTTYEDLYIQRIDAGGFTISLNGLPLVTKNYNQNSPRIVFDGDDAAIVVWEDYRNNALISDVYAQKIDDQGNILWGANDLEVCGAMGKQLGIRLNSDNVGGAVVAWRDERYGEYPEGDIFAQRLLSSGAVAWHVDGVPTCTEVYLQEAPLVRAFPNGKSTIAWGDSRYGSPGIFYQVYDANGNEQVTTNGAQVVWGIDGNAQHVRMIKLNDAENRFLAVWEDGRYSTFIGKLVYQQIFDLEATISLAMNGVPTSIKYDDFNNQMEGGHESPEIVSDGDGGAIMCYRDLRYINQTEQIYAQRLDGNGGILWDSLGVRVYPTDKSQERNRICSDGSGGAYIAWSGYNVQWMYNAFVAHMDAEGNILGVLELTESWNDEKMWGLTPDGSGGAYVYWQGGDWLDFNIYTARVVPPCDTLWSAVICDTIDHQNSPHAILDHNNDVIFVWEDRRDTLNYDIYCQKMDSESNKLWNPNGVHVANPPEGDQLLGDLAVDQDNNIYIVWQDQRVGLNNDLYLQKISSDGQLQFQSTGVPVAVQDADQWNPIILTDVNGYPQMCWGDFRNLLSDIYCSYMDPEGEVLSGWDVNGDPVCNFGNNQVSPDMVDDYSTGLVTIWEDLRSSGKVQLINIYVQRWDDSSNDVGGIEGDLSPRQFTLSQNYPNPFNPVTRIKYNLQQAGNVKLIIFNALGQEVARVVDEFQTSGIHTAVWDGKNKSGDLVASGIYYYRLEMNDKMKAMKMLMLK